AWALFAIIPSPYGLGYHFCRAYGAEETRSRKKNAARACRATAAQQATPLLTPQLVNSAVY
ncbi:MAG TPA: hypothetical protein VHN10_08850, partial [Candidatus Acidoferrales bacterium]|nr:hypothetical protein [Candidatus Acidoferrales bacterium]